jgi:hypothetical protein
LEEEMGERLHDDNGCGSGHVLQMAMFSLGLHLTHFDLLAG